MNVMLCLSKNVRATLWNIQLNQTDINLVSPCIKFHGITVDYKYTNFKFKHTQNFNPVLEVDQIDNSEFRFQNPRKYHFDPLVDLSKINRIHLFKFQKLDEINFLQFLKWTKITFLISCPLKHNFSKWIKNVQSLI